MQRRVHESVLDVDQEIKIKTKKNVSMKRGWIMDSISLKPLNNKKRVSERDFQEKQTCIRIIMYMKRSNTLRISSVPVTDIHTFMS